jgi:two-component system, NtrC family, sensor histidine kinase KinB
MKFTLRQKIFAVFAMLLLIAAFIALQSIQRFQQLGRSIDVILRENYRSVIACQQMKEALERIDSGLLFILSSFVKEGVDQIDVNMGLFQKALHAEMNNLTLPAEPVQAEALKKLFEQYHGKVTEFMSAQPQELRQIYFADLFPLFKLIKDKADTILQMNQENMNAANNRARIKAAKARRDMYFFLSFSALIAFLFMPFSNRWILRPIQHLIDSIQEIKKGNLNLVVKVDTRDEIGQLGEAFNAMVASLRVFRRSDQAKLVRLQRSTQEAIKNLTATIAIIDGDGLIEIATESARIHFALTPNTRIDRSPYPWLNNIYLDMIKNPPGPDQEKKFEIVQHFSNNQERFFKPKAIAILDDEKELSGVIIILDDVTLMMQNDEIRKDLFSTISHQLKTPLTSIRMALYLMLEEKVGDLNEKQAELLVSARDECERLYTIIEDLLDISRIESGNVKMNFSAMAPAELLEKALEPYFREAQDRGITIETDIATDLPDVKVDRSRIMYVFANLLANAITYTPVGGVIRVAANAEGDKVFFSVADNGCGIAKKFQKRVFEKFFRVPGQDTQGGAGLGLAIARDIVTAHNGQITFTSTEGQGTTFIVNLERAEKPAK